MLHGGSDTSRDVTAVGVVTHLGAVAEDVQRVLALQDLLYQVRHHMAHGQLHVAAEDLDVAERASFADPDTVERSHDRVGQAVLLVGGAREVLDGELLEAVGGTGWGDLALLALTRRPRRRRLENHRRADVGDLLETGVAEGADGGVAGRRDHALIGGQQVVRIGVEVGDAADHRRAGHEVVAREQQLGHQLGVSRVAFDEPVVRVGVVRLGDAPVLRVVVDPHDLVAAPQELFDDVTPDEAGRTAHEDGGHSLASRPKAKRYHLR